MHYFIKMFASLPKYDSYNLRVTVGANVRMQVLLNNSITTTIANWNWAWQTPTFFWISFKSLLVAHLLWVKMSVCESFSFNSPLVKLEQTGTTLTFTARTWKWWMQEEHNHNLKWTNFAGEIKSGSLSNNIMKKGVFTKAWKIVKTIFRVLPILITQRHICLGNTWLLFSFYLLLAV